MNCPRCGFESVVRDENFVQLNGSKMILKSIYQCKKCSFQFGRIIQRQLEGESSPSMSPQQSSFSPFSQPSQSHYSEPSSYSSQQSSRPQEEKKPADNLSFLDF